MLRKTLTTGFMFLSLAIPYFACSASSKLIGSGETSDVLDLDTYGNEDSKHCVSETATKVSSARPVDIIFVIDNSGSMSEEINAITKNINDHFATVMDQAGLDYRVIMVVKHGNPVESWAVAACFEAPLSKIPVGGCANIGTSPPGNNPGKFYHYSYDVQSNDSPCVILDTLFSVNDRPDTFGLAPNGWIKWLRTSAFKVIIEVTDDSPGCWWYPDPDKPKKKILNDFQSTIGGQIFALEFDKLLTKVAPQQFGTPENRNYVFYSIVGMLEKPEAVDEDFGKQIDPNGKPGDPFYPNEAIVNDTCSTAVTPGQGYQSLSNLTGGLRFPVCQADKFDVVFQKIAESIDSITTSICTLEIPAGGSEGPIDVATVELKISGAGNDALVLVKDETSCTGAADEYYIDATGGLVALCPETCKLVKSSSEDVLMTAGCVIDIK